ncbi:GTPase HflX [Xanthobacter agilis]|jgi:GTP-binding protein HflX|uniref:GTPase HflX n=1 Tax=Xanthobacter agilis TaxID=47492 RepID=A0ABU0LAX5_XANAG|nr:GTPase HflX [Xanthobacter agilis]MDQ0504290.1 GTP-binding protein HflX [Xanthobacter agilis]
MTGVDEYKKGGGAIASTSEGTASSAGVDRRAPPTRCAVITPYLTKRALRGQTERREPQARLDEAVGLAAAIDNLDVVYSALIPLSEIRPATFLGTGKVEEIGGVVKAEAVDLVFFDAALSPVQQRNLERAWAAKVVDRTALILEIFGQRARTKEGALQVELAHLNYQRSRLVRSWTHLERQRGGFGFLGGPGETQIEADRRLIGERIVRIEKELQQVKRTRGLHRASRKRVPYPVVALVGYTNAGKSTLFNRLTQADVTAQDLLFATLDPTLRAVDLPHGTRIILSDTVGFISDLPTQLVAAFRATLEEVLEADLILHVRDISHPDSEAQSADVADVLTELGVEVQPGGRVVEVWNKIDRLELEAREAVLNSARRLTGVDAPVVVSALSGEGTGDLLDVVERRITAGRSTLVVTLAAADGEGMGWLYRHGEVLDRATEPDGAMRVTLRIAPERVGLVKRHFGSRQVRGT